MDDSQAVRLITRALTIICLMLGFLEVVYLPADILSLLHHMHEEQMHLLGSIGLLELDKFYIRYYLAWSAARVLATAVLLYFAGMFYRCGAAVRRFFGLAEVHDCAATFSE
jgi:hypothetical protein